MPDRETVEVSVVIPTIGRPELLRQALRSLSMCDPRPAEVLVVDQSDDVVSASVVDEFDLPTFRVLACPVRGLGRAINDGLRNATHRVVLKIDDDCTVSADWVGVAWREMKQDPGG